eukprot:snap_masked-scaffold_3-processed-gene-15.54-mRNA-1 protein AED:1.00 eAED:1.00 QI:0/-1/0/0/-1/1/1/0/75
MLSAFVAIFLIFWNQEDEFESSSEKIEVGSFFDYLNGRYLYNVYGAWKKKNQFRGATLNEIIREKHDQEQKAKYA